MLNRASIHRHGLDWTHMGATCGIAGSRRPEVEGVFLCLHEFDVDFFVGMNAPQTDLDVWVVDGVDVGELIDNGHGFYYLPARIPPNRLTRRDAPPPQPVRHQVGPSDAYRSTITLTLDDGTVLRDQEVHAYIRRAREREGQ